jgi:peptidyl-prolyl cis-trans isomerase SurA
VRNVLTATGNGTSIRRWSRASCPVALVVLTTVAGCNTTHNADVMSTVNGKAIMKAELDKAYQVQLGDAQQQQQKPTREQADSLRLNVLRQLIDEEIVEQRAAKMNLTASNEEVDAKLAEMKAPYTEDQFNEKLKASNHTLDDVKHDIRRSLTFNKLLSKEIDSKINVTDADVAAYYNAHKSEYNLIETQYHLAQIQVTSVPFESAGQSAEQ